LLLSLEAEVVGFDCLTRTNGTGEGDVVGLSSDFVCRGGIGGGRGRFFFDSLSRKTKIRKECLQLSFCWRGSMVE
jgi:hypothetical protein